MPQQPQADAGARLQRLYDVGEGSIAIARLDEAAWCFEQAALLDAQAARPHKGLAKVRLLQDRADDARAAAAAACALVPAEAENHLLLGQACQALGDFTAARSAFAQAIALDPAHGAAHLRLALLPGGDDPATRLPDLQRAAALPGLSADQAAPIAYALARALEATGAHDAAFAQFARANAIRHRQHPGYSNQFRDAGPLIRAYGADVLAQAPGGDPTDRLVFIVGMMRSGTTLVEQILASHPDVHGHGELADIRRIAADLGGGDPQRLAAAPDDAIARAAAAYLARRVQAAPNARIHIDKLPHNFEHVGLIARLFPHARIIHCTRDPRDSCWSNYTQDFGHLNLFTYDLATLGRYWRQYDRLMAHWQAHRPGRILTIPYEALVADQEGCSRRVLAFLDLPWHDACLAFHRNTRAVFTKSLWQVRQPLFASAIGRWKPYAHHLGALFSALETP